MLRIRSVGCRSSPPTRSPIHSDAIPTRIWTWLPGKVPLEEVLVDRSPGPPEPAADARAGKPRPQLRMARVRVQRRHVQIAQEERRLVAVDAGERGATQHAAAAVR